MGEVPGAGGRRGGGERLGLERPWQIRLSLTPYEAAEVERMISVRSSADSGSIGPGSHFHPTSRRRSWKPSLV